MKAFAISFHDNDFAKVLMTFGDLFVSESHKEFNRDWLSKTKIVELFNKAAPTLYWIVQNRGNYARDWDSESYLKIDPSQVFFDNEIYEHEEVKLGNTNCEWVIVNLELKTCILI